jgi:hypothetical protein
MAKRKAQRSAKPRSGPETRSKVNRAKTIGHNTRAKSKQDAVLALPGLPSEATATLLVANERYCFAAQ